MATFKIASRLLSLAMLSVLLCGIVVGSAVAQPGDPYERSLGGWGNRDYYDRGGYDDDRAIDREYDDLQDERRQLALERDRLERQREEMLHNQDDTSSRQTEQCPSGFQQSEQKCSVEERRQGCKDLRLPSGIGCVKR